LQTTGAIAGFANFKYLAIAVPLRFSAFNWQFRHEKPGDCAKNRQIKPQLPEKCF
jgi:hypothetical protein